MRKEQPNDSSPHPEQPILLEGGNFKAKDKDGTYPRNVWVFLPDSGGISEGRFYFDANGYLKTGWLLDSSDGTWYYLDPENGSILADWHEINDKWYCFSWGAYGKSSASCIATRGRRMAIPSMRAEPGPETEDKKDDRVICRPFCPLSLKRRV